MMVTEYFEKFGSGDWISETRLIRSWKDPEILEADGFFDVSVLYNGQKLYHILKPLVLSDGKK